jgi:DNA gyrase subunit B
MYHLIVGGHLYVAQPPLFRVKTKRDTTLDPAHRTLLQVTMQDAGAADDMFRILMGDKVEPRREFIEKHALEVRNLDV